MGRIAAPFGVKGWLKIQPFTAEPDGLLAYPRWWIGRDEAWESLEVEQAKAQGGSVVAKFPGCDDRDAALRYRGAQVAVTKAELPASGKNEFYWADLIGLKVVNEASQDLGAVVQMIETGANDVLVVQGERERLIPFIADVVRQVDVAGGSITVDWDADF
jgi:16S rRNA processing protein RimM